MPSIINYLHFLPSSPKLHIVLNKTYPLWKSQQSLHPIKYHRPSIITFQSNLEYGGRNKMFMSNQSKQSSNKKTGKEEAIGKLTATHATKKMGQGDEVKTRNDPQTEIQERGEIFFFYRPKVSKEEVQSANDIQRMYIVLRPESGEKSVEEKQSPLSGKEGAKSGRSSSSSSSEEEKAEDDEEDRVKEHPEGGHGKQEVNIEKQTLLRFIVMGRKSLPDPGKRSRPFWGFVELVTTKVDDIKDALQGEEYDTATRGHRHKPIARALGEGVYRILRHKYSERRVHTHLVYKLELPPEDKKNEPQEELNVEREGSFIIQIKNPEQSGGRSEFQGVQNKRKAVFPAHLQGQFGMKRFQPADPPDFLNYEGCELLLISASDYIEEELGLEVRPETDVLDPKSSDFVKTFGDDTVPTTPLFEGAWY